MQKQLFPHSKDSRWLLQISPEKRNAYGKLFQSPSETSNDLQVLQFVLLKCLRKTAQSLSENVTMWLPRNFTSQPKRQNMNP